jgi:hypothetical protein
MHSYCAALDRDGFLVIEEVLPRDQMAGLVAFVERSLTVSDGRGGLRNLLAVPEMRELAESQALRGLVEPVLGKAAKVVRGTLFDKTSAANWKVPWHQDVTIAVAARVEAEGFGPWSVKVGILHVQPPAAVLEQMLSVRIHLDDCPAANGALRVLPGSHTKGKIAETEIRGSALRNEAVACEVAAGGVLLMRPLLLHASSASAMPGHRRVLHFDYAAAVLPAGMDWAV